MSFFKCKMCGGTVEFNQGDSVGVCDSCGTKQTLPRLDNDKKVNLYDRADHFRRNNDFDKAMSIYEQILNEDNTDAEAYWSIVLCRYGIEYVEDPSSHKRVPTVNRAQFTSIYADEDYKSAIQYADMMQRSVYEEEAKAIDDIQKGILEISNKEEPFDVFICYKETDNNGRRSPDSVLANDLYHQLTQEGFRVFFSRITLEDKLGSAYEPYIFAALNSAKVMVVLGTRSEYFNAVWVKNEWSRYLTLIKNGDRKILIPAYKDMDPYDLPEEFSHLQAQDMSKLGFMQDLIRGIKKITAVNESKVLKQETIVVNNGGNANIEPLLKRAFMFLEDGEWDKADDFCEQVLNQNPENARAYLGKLMAELRVTTQSDLKNCKEPFDNNKNYAKVCKFADDDLKNELFGYISYIKERNENARLEKIYSRACKILESSKSETEIKKAKQDFESISSYKDSVEKVKECEERVKYCIYCEAVELFRISNTELGVINAKSQFERIVEYKDSAMRIELCDAKINEIIEKKEVIKRKKTIVTTCIIVSTIVLCVTISIFKYIIIPKIEIMQEYNNAISTMNNGEYEEAYYLFKEIADYKDSKEYQYKCIDYVRTNITSHSISAGDCHTVGLKADGTVVAVGSNRYGQQRRVSNWKDIVAISAGYFHTVGLKSDGTVVAVGRNDDGQCDVSNWKDIVAISAGGSHTVGLKSDGTVVAVGRNGDVSEWTDIVAISAGGSHTVGLKSDGTVVAVGRNGGGQCDVSEWTDIVAISAGHSHTVGLKSDGTVVAVGLNESGQCTVSEWTDIVAISAGDCHTVGLKADGTVVAVGWNEYGQCNVSKRTDIVAISAGGYHTVGLKADGTVVAFGVNRFMECNVSNWTDIQTQNLQNK